MPSPRSAIAIVALWFWLGCGAALAAVEPGLAFDLPAGDAASTLKIFAEQSHRPVVYMLDSVGGRKTKAVKGRLEPREALERMLADTDLIAVEDAQGGGLAVRRRPAARAPAPAAEDRIVLSPFSVSAEADVGFVAATSLAGGRMATTLKDTPVAYSVITREFVDAFSLTDVIEAAQWSTNVNQNEADGGTRMYGKAAVTMVRIRGIKMGLPTRNFFTVSRTSDAYNLDRVDLARGPNSVLFGAGGIAGTLNSMTKQAEPGRRFGELQLRLGSFRKFRATADLNEPIGESAALRANVLYEEGGTWRDHEFVAKQGATLAGKFALNPRLTLRGEFEYLRQVDGTVNASLRDRISAWDGLTTTLGRGLPGTGAGFTGDQLAAAGLAPIQQRFVQHPNWGGTFHNFQDGYETKGAQHRADPAATNRINGVPIRTVGFSLQDQALADAEDGVPLDRWARAQAGSPYFRRPRRTDTTIWTNRSLPLAGQRSTDATLVVNYSPRENLHFEVAANHSTSRQFGENTQRRGLINVTLDVNRTLPDGSPNPGFLKNYVDVFNYHNHRNYAIGQVRAQAVYGRNFSAGRLQLSAIAGAHRQRVEAIGTSMLLPLTSLAADARSWTDVSTLSEYGAYTRWYVNDGSARVWRDLSNQPVKVFNPRNGVGEVVQPTYMYDTRREENNHIGYQRFRFVQAAGNFDLLRNRLVLIGAFRRDFTSIYTRRAIYPGDNPAGWDGRSRTWRPDAPADYYQLTYLLKDTAGRVIDPQWLPATSRPRGRTATHANFGFAQYAADRFQDDYNAPIYHASVSTYTAGAVVNLSRRLGLYANTSTTFDLALPAQRVDGSLVPPTASRGQDYGLRYTLPGNRLAVSLGRYTSFQDGATVRATANVNVFSTIAAAPVVGDLSATGRNIRGFRQLPQDIYSTATNTAAGYEFEATANFTPGWRLMLNAGYVDSELRDQQPDVRRWIPQQDAIARQILADAGVVIDASNDAHLPAALNDPAKVNVTKVQDAVDAWNELQDSIIPNLANQRPRLTGGATHWTGNLATDYRLRAGWLPGLRVGAGLNFRSGQVIGFRGGDTVRDPNNPAVAIDDPAVDANTPIIAPSYTKVVATLSYLYRFKDTAGRLAGKSLQLDFYVDNLLDEADVIYSNINDIVQTGVTNFRPRVGEDITSPARRTVPGNFGYLPPRSYTVSAKLKF